MENIVNRLFAEIERRGGSVPKFSIETGIPKDRVYKWKQQGTIPKATDEKKILEWLAVDIVSHESTNSLKKIEDRISDLEALTGVLASSIAELLSATSGENREVLRRKIYKAAEDLRKMGD